MSKHKESALLEIFHFLLIIAAYTSPFWMDWRVIVGCAILLLLQFVVFKTCIINKVQYKNTDDTFYSRNLRRFGIPHDPVKVKRIFRYYVLVLIPIVALLWQVVLAKPAPLG